MSRQPETKNEDLETGHKKTAWGRLTDRISQDNDTIMHMIMAFVGGFTAVYAIMLRDANLGQAATANLIEMFGKIALGNNWTEVIYRVIAFGVFGGALLLSHMYGYFRVQSARTLCLIVEAAGVFIAGWIPATAPAVPALYPIFFLTAWQWSNFAGARGFGCSTIFSSNNVKQMIFGWMDYRMTKDPRMKEKGMFYTLTLCFFNGSALLGGFAVKRFGVRSIWLCLIPLAVAGIVYSGRDRMELPDE